MAYNDTRISGVNGAIYLGGLKGSGGTKVTAKTRWTLSQSRDYFDASAFGDSNRRWLAGLRDTQGTYEGILDVSGDKLFDAAALGAQFIALYADDNSGASSQGLYLIAHGSGFLDAQVDCSLNDVVKITGQFRASANWTFFTGS
jgi:hypothetical protein